MNLSKKVKYKSHKLCQRPIHELRKSCKSIMYRMNPISQRYVIIQCHEIHNFVTEGNFDSKKNLVKINSVHLFLILRFFSLNKMRDGTQKQIESKSITLGQNLMFLTEKDMRTTTSECFIRLTEQIFFFPDLSNL